MTRGGSTNSLPEPWRTLAINAGGVQALAAIFGVKSTSTVYRWAHKQVPLQGLALDLFKQLVAEMKAKKGKR